MAVTEVEKSASRTSSRSDSSSMNPSYWYALLPRACENSGLALRQN